MRKRRRQNSNPFLLCTLISLRIRQIMMAGNGKQSTAQLVDSALGELLAGALEYERGKPRRPLLIQAESGDEESNGGLESPAVPVVSASALSPEAR